MDASITTRALATALALLAAAGCTTPKPANDIAADGGLANGKFKPAEKTTVVGTMGWVSYIDSTGTIRLNRPMLPPGTFLVTRDSSLNATSILQATPTNYGRHQGVLIINGQPKENDEVVEPGPDLASLIDFNLSRNREAQAAQVMQAAGTAAPEVVPGQ